MTTTTKPSTKPSASEDAEGTSTMTMWKPEINAAPPGESAVRPTPKRKSRAQRAADKAAADKATAAQSQPAEGDMTPENADAPETPDEPDETVTTVDTSDLDTTTTGDQPTEVVGDTSADASDSTGVDLDEENIQQIVKLEAEADGLTSEADAFRAQAAQRIVRELERGATERAVATAIGKTPAHVHHAKVAWNAIQGEINEGVDEEHRTSFNDAYKNAKRKKGSGNVDSVTLEFGDDDGDLPFPPWSKQMRELKRLTSEMIEQSNFKQSDELGKVLARMGRAAVTKHEELAEAAGA